MQNGSPYDDSFFDKHTEGALRSARAAVPILLNLVQVRSVLDVGCGRGAWLKAFEENGVKTILGLDGSYLNRSGLLIGLECYRAVDLRIPFQVEDAYDLAVCLEVAEHLPASASRRLIRTLTRASRLVLFSAAVPGQGGTAHVNEQWPAYWETIFVEQGFQRLDPLRFRLWHDERVEWWYRQNLFLYASDKAIAESTALCKECERTRSLELTLIHSDVLNRYTSLSGILREVPGALRRAVVRRLPWHR